MNTYAIRILLLALVSSGILCAQEPVAAPPASAAKAEAAQKSEPPKPITPAEKENFRKQYVEYLEAQNNYATRLLSLKTQMEDLEKTSNQEMQTKAQGIQQLFNELSKRCVAPKIFDRISADCQDPPKK